MAVLGCLGGCWFFLKPLNLENLCKISFKVSVLGAEPSDKVRVCMFGGGSGVLIQGLHKDVSWAGLLQRWLAVLFWKLCLEGLRKLSWMAYMALLAAVNCFRAELQNLRSVGPCRVGFLGMSSAFDCASGH